MKEYFQPPQRVLNAIQFDREGLEDWFTFPAKLHESTALAAHQKYVEEIIEEIRGFYAQQRTAWQLPFDGSPQQLNIQEMLFVLSEGLENARIHGAKNGEFYALGLWVARNGVCYGFYDPGAYFCHQEVKHTFESRLPVSEYDRNCQSRVAGLGLLGFIYPHSDVIAVNTEQGILYCAQLAQRVFLASRLFIVPESNPQRSDQQP